MGERLGLSGEQLRQWVQAEQKHLRDERALECEETAREQTGFSERTEHERVKAQQKRARAEVEESNLQLRIRLAETNSARGEGAQKDGEGQTTGQVQTATAQSLSAHKFLPPFEDTRDHLNAYLNRFECLNRNGPLR